MPKNKIIAMLPVKNEAWVLRHCLSSLSFCDEILAIDDSSTDTTRSILEEYNCTILPFDTEARVGWKEYEIRVFLLQEARRRGATHLIGIDGDEMFTNAFIREARSIMSAMVPGQSIAMPWINAVDEHHVYAPILHKVFIMCDDGSSEYRETFLHVPRVPTYHHDMTLEAPLAVLHFQYLNQMRNMYKQAWYKMSELLKGGRHPMRINSMYDHNLTSTTFDIAGLIDQPLPNPATDQGVWQRAAVLKLVDEKGIRFFEPLNIWDITELKERFINEVGREPRPSIAPPWLLVMNNLKNRIKNAYRARFS